MSFNTPHCHCYKAFRFGPFILKQRVTTNEQPFACQTCDPRRRAELNEARHRYHQSLFPSPCPRETGDRNGGTREPEGGIARRIWWAPSKAPIRPVPDEGHHNLARTLQGTRRSRSFAEVFREELNKDKVVCIHGCICTPNYRAVAWILLQLLLCSRR
jgi:hypothetical protein